MIWKLLRGTNTPLLFKYTFISFITSDIYLDAVSLYIIPRYRGKKEIIRTLQKVLRRDYPDADYLRFELPTSRRKFNQPCFLVCQVPLKV